MQSNRSVRSCNRQLLREAERRAVTWAHQARLPLIWLSGPSVPTWTARALARKPLDHVGAGSLPLPDRKVLDGYEALVPLRSISSSTPRKGADWRRRLALSVLLSRKSAIPAGESTDKTYSHSSHAGGSPPHRFSQERRFRKASPTTSGWRRIRPANRRSRSRFSSSIFA